MFKIVQTNKPVSYYEEREVFETEFQHLLSENKNEIRAYCLTRAGHSPNYNATWELVEYKLQIGVPVANVRHKPPCTAKPLSNQ